MAETPPGSTPAAAAVASGSPRKRTALNNWISAIGAVLAAGGLFSFALLVWMDFTQDHGNPYLGIFTYLVAPAFLIGGLGLVAFGAWAQLRWERKHGATAPDRWRLDLSDPRRRRRVIWFGAGALVFFGLSAFGSYQTYHYSESVAFCGQVCHEAMNPEFVAYQRGAHARVDCVACHIGSGAEWFVKAKINGTHQLIAYTLNNYSRPIDTPLRQLRPAQDICEKCHWPEKFHGNVEMTYEHFLSDKRNTPYTVRMLMHVNRSNEPGGHAGGIHWHVSEGERVEYYATDPKRQEIPWMRVTNLATGAQRVFRTEEFTGEPPPAGIRVMDCMDCHNRPAHVFPTANDSIEHAMASAALTTKLPNLKRVAAQAMIQESITSDAAAPARIAEYLQSKYPDPVHAAELPGAIAAVTSLRATTMFAERKADWRVYPDNIGHKDWPGCFRCHDNKHRAADGATVRSSDCRSCHTILAQGKGTELDALSVRGLDFAHPGGELDPDLTCADCHNGAVQK